MSSWGRLESGKVFLKILSLSVSGQEQHKYEALLDDDEYRQLWNFQQQICPTMHVNYEHQNKEVNRQRDFYAERVFWVKQLPRVCLPKAVVLCRAINNASLVECMVKHNIKCAEDVAPGTCKRKIVRWNSSASRGGATGSWVALYTRTYSYYSTYNKTGILS